MKYFAVAPGAVWTALIVGLTGLAIWLTDYLNAPDWAPLVAGLLTVVIVPVLKVLAQEQDAQRVFDGRGLYRITPGNRLVRWLW